MSIKDLISGPFEEVPVPWKILPDGREYLTAEQLVESPELRNFVRRFEHLFEFPFNRDIVIFNRPKA